MIPILTHRAQGQYKTGKAGTKALIAESIQRLCAKEVQLFYKPQPDDLGK